MSLFFEQCSAHTLADGTYIPCYGTRTQTASTTPIGGRTSFTVSAGIGFGRTDTEWRMFTGQFGVVSWGGMSNGGGSTCASPSSIIPAPYFATIGSSGDLATCTVSMIPGGGQSSETLRWTVRASSRPGMALVCMQNYCYRTDEQGNVDPTMYPWAPE
jgi:hypothetical protein